MKKRLQLLFTALIILSACSFAQSITGNWYGIGTVGKDGNYSQYLSELILVQTGNSVKGEYNYYFKSTYLPSKVTGTYNSKTRVLQLKVFPLLNFKAAGVNGADCPMKGTFVLKVSKVETTLDGLFEPIDKYKYTCPSITIKFKKEILTPEEKKIAQQKKKNPEPEIEEEEDELPTVVQKVDTTPAKPVTVPQIAPPPVIKQADTIKPAIVKRAEELTKALVTRTFEASPVIEVDSDSLVLSLYDNGEVDGDTVAVFHNRKLLISDQRLSDKPIHFTVPIDTTVHEISLYAINLGSIPPNTALCVIMAGEKRYELVLSSNFIRNGTIRFRKKTQAQIEADKKVLQ